MQTCALREQLLRKMRAAISGTVAPRFAGVAFFFLRNVVGANLAVACDDIRSLYIREWIRKVNGRELPIASLQIAGPQIAGSIHKLICDLRVQKFALLGLMQLTFSFTIL